MLNSSPKLANTAPINKTVMRLINCLETPTSFKLTCENHAAQIIDAHLQDDLITINVGIKRENCSACYPGGKVKLEGVLKEHLSSTIDHRASIWKCAIEFRSGWIHPGYECRLGRCILNSENLECDFAASAQTYFPSRETEYEAGKNRIFPSSCIESQEIPMGSFCILQLLKERSDVLSLS